MFDNVTGLFKPLSKVLAQLRDTGLLGLPSLYPEVDKLTKGFIPGKVYTIAAYSNTGKTKFMYSYVADFIKRNIPVLIVNLEVDPIFSLKDIVVTMEGKPEKEINLEQVDTDPYYNLDIINEFKLSKIIEIVMNTEAEVICIDFIQNIQSDRGSSNYEKMANIAQALQRLAIESQKVLICISQVSNTVGKEVQRGNKDFVTLKGAGELFASSDVIMLLNREGEDLALRIIKNKYGPLGEDFEVKADLSVNKFDIKRYR